LNYEIFLFYRTWTDCLEYGEEWKDSKASKRQKKIMDLFADAMNAAWP
jgi:hypothetical protein